LEQAIKLSIIYGCTIDYIAYGKEPAQKDNSVKVLQNLEVQLESERKLNKFLSEEVERLKAKKK